jgi:hypothetical protein
MASACASSLSARVAFKATAVQAKSSKAAAPVRAVQVVKADAEATLSTRRSALAAFSAAAVAVSAKPSLAAYGEGANIFGKKTKNTEFIPYAGDGFAVLVPGFMNPSKEQDFPGTVFRYEDNGDAVTNLIVTATKTGKSSIEEYGSPEKFLAENSFLLGKSSQTFISRSEGGFAENRVAAASLLDAGVSEKKGKKYYELEVLTRTADGDEGGRHHLIVATVSANTLYTMKFQIGDKRWFKGLERPAKQTAKSFTVA